MGGGGSEANVSAASAAAASIVATAGGAPAPSAPAMSLVDWMGRTSLTATASTDCSTPTTVVSPSPPAPVSETFVTNWSGQKSCSPRCSSGTRFFAGTLRVVDPSCHRTSTNVCVPTIVAHGRMKASRVVSVPRRVPVSVIVPVRVVPALVTPGTPYHRLFLFTAPTAPTLSQTCAATSALSRARRWLSITVRWDKTWVS